MKESPSSPPPSLLPDTPERIRKEQSWEHIKIPQIKKNCQESSKECSKIPRPSRSISFFFLEKKGRILFLVSLKIQSEIERRILRSQFQQWLLEPQRRQSHVGILVPALLHQQANPAENLIIFNKKKKKNQPNNRRMRITSKSAINRRSFRSNQFESILKEQQWGGRCPGCNTYRVWIPSIRNGRSILVNADDFSHIFEARIRWNHIEEGRSILFNETGRYCAAAHFPENQAEGVDIRTPERFEQAHVDPAI